MKLKIIRGNSLKELPKLSANSVDSIVTDPPYGLSFMGKLWDRGVPGIELWTEALRVLKPGGYLLAFGGTRTYHRMACHIEDAGFEIRDCLSWLYGSGFPKSLNVSKARAGWGTALKPAHEPIVMARKPLSEKTVLANVRRWGTGAINIDGGRIGITDGTKTGRTPVYCPNSWKNTSAKTGSMNDDWKKGRFPANLLLDEHAAEALDRQSGLSSARGGKPKGKSVSVCAVPIAALGGPKVVRNDFGGASRFFYVAKASRKERNAGLEGMDKRSPWKSFDGQYAKGRNPKSGKRTGGYNPAQFNHHPTVKPLTLMRYLVRLVTPPGGTVLDPFTGSGTTGCAARIEGFKFIGIELAKEYVAIARGRVRAAEAAA
jgi:site-specific DNA-methyltransferase (adenine-specific)